MSVAALKDPLMGGGTGHLIPPSPSVLLFLVPPHPNMGEVLRRLSNTAGSDFQLSSTQYSSGLWWISTEAAEASQQRSKGARLGRPRTEQQIDGEIDRWHRTSAGGSTKSRVPPKSSWVGPSLRLQGPPSTHLLFSEKNKRFEQTGSLREHLSRWEFWQLLFLLQKTKKVTFFPPFFTANWL